MNRKQIDSLLLRWSISGFGIMSVSFLLMPIEGISMLAGGMFWIGLLMGLVLQVVLEMRRRDFLARHRIKRQRMQRTHNGLLTFGANKVAIIADGVLVVSTICLALSFWLTRGTSYLCYILIALVVFSLCMHCVFNGRIYFHVINQTKIQQTLEKKKVRTFRKERDHNVQ